ncbi:hypothetical protein HMPREF1584_00844 [Gardnerella vaginalis JCP8481A]|nr:hypothetical protein HMPREF1584_00844 [Gardnerella vaginalis JCP8481A]
MLCIPQRVHSIPCFQHKVEGNNIIDAIALVLLYMLSSATYYSRTYSNM